MITSDIRHQTTDLNRMTEHYKNNIKTFIEKEGLGNLSPLPDTEEYFSWNGCECCKNPLGNSFMDCNGYNFKLKQIQGPYRVCLDCVFYLEYGDNK